MLAFLLTSAALHGVWEFAQCTPLYVEGRFPMTLRGMLRVTAADVGLSVLIYGLVALGRRKLAWGLRPARADILAAMGIGAVIAAAIEWHALNSGRWAYTASMPTLMGIGLLPLLQLGVGTILPIGMGRWLGERASS